MSIYVKRNNHSVDPEALIEELQSGDVTLESLRESEWSFGVLETKLKLSYGDGLNCEYEPHEFDCETDWLDVQHKASWHVKWHMLRYNDENEIELPEPWFADDVNLKRPDTQTFKAWVSWSGGHSLNDLLSCANDGPISESLTNLIDTVQDLIDNEEESDNA